MDSKMFNTCVNILKSIQQSCKTMESLLVTCSELPVRPKHIILYTIVLIYYSLILIFKYLTG